MLRPFSGAILADVRVPYDGMKCNGMSNMHSEKKREKLWAIY